MEENSAGKTKGNGLLVPALFITGVIVIFVLLKLFIF